MEVLQKLQRKKEVSKVNVKGYRGQREFFWGKREGCVYINKGTRYREQIGSWGR
jgi:hypothetical protein